MTFSIMKLSLMAHNLMGLIVTFNITKLGLMVHI
jgi:hypothetical protein